MNCMGCSKDKNCEESCFWCESPFCKGCIATETECRRRNTYLVCKGCDDVPLTGQVE